MAYVISTIVLVPLGIIAAYVAYKEGERKGYDNGLWVGTTRTTKALLKAITEYDSYSNEKEPE